MMKRIWWAAAASGGAVGWWLTRRLRAQSLRGRVAVVTGGTRGLGLRIATLLAQAGCPVAICARDEHDVKQAGLRLAGYGSSVMARRGGVRDPGGGEEIVHGGRGDLWRLRYFVKKGP